jgi:N-acetylneuraminic acid mutarotase
MGRDGHCQVAVPTQNAFVILGGNSQIGALNDCWLFERRTCQWTELPRLPGAGRYSFSANLLKDRYIVVFGGCDNKEKNYFNELFVLDMDDPSGRPVWRGVKTLCGGDPTPRCRHASNIF